VMQSVAGCCRVLQSVAVCCSVLQCVAVCCRRLVIVFSSRSTSLVFISVTTLLPTLQCRESIHNVGRLLLMSGDYYEQCRETTNLIRNVKRLLIMSGYYYEQYRETTDQLAMSGDY